MTKGPVVLEKTWARRFGVRRSGGMYRIAHWELMERFKVLQQPPMEKAVGSSVTPRVAAGSSRVIVADRAVTLRAGLSESDHADPAGTWRE